MQYIPIPYFFISTARLPPIQKPYSLHQSALVGDQNGIQVLGLWTFVLEERGDVPNYISSLDSSGACKGEQEYGGLYLKDQKVRDTGKGDPGFGLVQK